MAFFTRASLSFSLAAFALPAFAEDHWPKDASVYIISPADGAKVKGPVTVVMGLAGLGVAPAGVDKPKTGHHHILVDADPPKGADLMNPLPVDDHFRHFGGGQTQTVLTLAPGPHTLQLLVGDQNHVPYDPPLASQKISIVVE
jgi:Domain of unknown function (DUF4399)